MSQEETSAAEQAMSEHRDLLRTVSSLTRFTSADYRPARDEIGDLIGAVKRFRDKLDRHFTREEDSGLFDDVLVRLPSSEALVGALRGEHVRFLEIADAIIHGLERHKREEELASIQRDLSRFIEAFQRHEAREDGLFRKAYSTEMGGGD